MSYLKPQTPLQHKDGDYFYPLTTIDQVIMEDGLTRLSGADLVSVSTDGAPEGEVVGINADTLGGYAADAYVKKTDAMIVTKNYSVVGGVDEPTIPTENMIWIQTENTIGKVHFSGVEPNNINDNDIWIYTGNSSSVAFDAIKIGDDTMNTVYPLSAKQYVSGAWVDKTAKSYREGAWETWWKGEVFVNGKDYVGGFDTTLADGSVTIGDTIRIARNRVNGNTIVKGKLPLTVLSYTVLKFTITKHSAKSTETDSNYYDHVQLKVKLLDSKTNTIIAQTHLNLNTLTTGTHTISITPPGKYYFQIELYTYLDCGTADIEFTDIHFE